MNTITCILTIYKRVDYLENQIKSLLAQTHKIDKFIFCVNNTEEKSRYTEIINRLAPNSLIVEFSENLWVYNRFFLWFNANTDLVMVLDDDNTPWSKWIENAVKVLQEEECIIGSWGSIFKSLEVRRDRTIISEAINRPKELTLVNISWHSWVFRKQTLPKMFSLLPTDLWEFKVCWEELLVSWNASKEWIKTYILPMTDDKETWWDKTPTLWHDKHAWFNKYGNNLYQKFYDYCVLLWYNPIKDYEVLSNL